ncbi:TIGR01548 family HAD-type hydrolase [Chamaesiphon sp. VAR_48_metabat_135_sub]|uniref:TIGR01548 family HAD-type hydrolase n=1 Tax=Chamaesiphon sp. VAR_48_metabat_135_sub TaxID=2964699 RepID=UPI00286A5286|nr:TIGR01548 family HAD-type hydrolase [Chamaesiphon sp. VAR_48_metabat_135_sub]
MSAIVIFDIDGVIRDVGSSYRRALADTVAEFTNGVYRPTAIEIDRLKGEGIWNNDWEASQELIYRYFEGQGQTRSELNLDYERIVAYFQTKYRGTDPVKWNGYICDEPILASLAYFASLTAATIPWGFFSGATQGSAGYILERRLGLTAPVLVAMEDAPGKPDPQGLFMAVAKLGLQHGNIDSLPIIYVGDTVADMQTIINARKVQAERDFMAIGVLPPHILTEVSQVDGYRESLVQAGARVVINNVQELTPGLIGSL